MNIEQTGFIDLHHHVFPSWYTTESSQDASVLQQFSQWSVERDFALMERQGMATAMLSFPMPFSGTQSRRFNEFIAGLVQQYPQKYGSLGALPLPDIQAATVEAIYALDTLKLDGITLMSNYQGSYLANIDADELLSELNKRHAVVFLHPADPPEGTHGAPGALYEFTFETTRAIALLLLAGKLEKYPEIRWVLAHAGGTLPYLAYRISSMVGTLQDTQATTFPTRGEQKVMETIRGLYYDTAISGSSLLLPTLQAVADPRHILFGSDATAAPEIAIVQNTRGLFAYSGFSPDEQHMIASENARVLFPRLRAF
jgi:6-methylsalicylate decarboxylase